MKHIRFVESQKKHIKQQNEVQFISRYIKCVIYSKFILRLDLDLVSVLSVFYLSVDCCCFFLSLSIRFCVLSFFYRTKFLCRNSKRANEKTKEKIPNISCVIQCKVNVHKIDFFFIKKKEQKEKKWQTFLAFLIVHSRKHFFFLLLFWFECVILCVGVESGSIKLDFIEEAEEERINSIDAMRKFEQGSTLNQSPKNRFLLSLGLSFESERDRMRKARNERTTMKGRKAFYCSCRLSFLAHIFSICVFSHFEQVIRCLLYF